MYNNAQQVIQCDFLLRYVQQFNARHLPESLNTSYGDSGNILHIRSYKSWNSFIRVLPAKKT